jgi:hypothetical protein
MNRPMIAAICCLALAAADAYAARPKRRPARKTTAAAPSPPVDLKFPHLPTSGWVGQSVYFLHTPGSRLRMPDGVTLGGDSRRNPSSSRLAGRIGKIVTLRNTEGLGGLLQVDVLMSDTDELYTIDLKNGCCLRDALFVCDLNGARKRLIGKVLWYKDTARRTTGR